MGNKSDKYGKLHDEKKEIEFLHSTMPFFEIQKTIIECLPGMNVSIMYKYKQPTIYVNIKDNSGTYTFRLSVYPVNEGNLVRVSQLSGGSHMYDKFYDAIKPRLLNA